MTHHRVVNNVISKRKDHPRRTTLVLRNSLHKLPVIHLVIARINRALKQLVHLLLAHLLAQIRQDVLDLALADEPRAVLVKHLEAADVLFDVEGLAEAAGPVEDLAEGFEIDCGGLVMHGVGRTAWVWTYSLRLRRAQGR